MRTANQLTFTTYETSLKLKPNDPTKVIFDSIDWSFIHPLVKNKLAQIESCPPPYVTMAGCVFSAASISLRPRPTALLLISVTASVKTFFTKFSIA